MNNEYVDWFRGLVAPLVEKVGDQAQALVGVLVVAVLVYAVIESYTKGGKGKKKGANKR